LEKATLLGNPVDHLTLRAETSPEALNRLVVVAETAASALVKYHREEYFSKQSFCLLSRYVSRSIQCCLKDKAFETGGSSKDVDGRMEPLRLAGRGGDRLDGTLKFQPPRSIKKT
jgi:hypothetical protein